MERPPVCAGVHIFSGAHAPRRGQSPAALGVSTARQVIARCHGCLSQAAFCRCFWPCHPQGTSSPTLCSRGRKATGLPSSGKEFQALQVCCFLKGSPGLAPAPDVCPSAQSISLDQPPPKIQKGRREQRSVRGRVSTHPGASVPIASVPAGAAGGGWPGRRVVALPGPDGALRGGGCSAAGS